MQEKQDALLTFPVQYSVFISPDQNEIEQIDEIELTPHIQIKETDKEVIVSGHLKLEGKYAGKSPKWQDTSIEDHNIPVTGYVDSVVFNPFSMDPNEFEEVGHLTLFAEKIPVHICIARDKIEDVEQIYASIVSFDYDIQSARKLSIMAELALNGVRRTTHVEEKEAITDEEESLPFPQVFEYIASRQEETIRQEESEPDAQPVNEEQTESLPQAQPTEEEQGLEMQPVKAEETTEAPQVQSVAEKQEVEIQPVKAEETAEPQQVQPVVEEQEVEIQPVKAEETAEPQQVQPVVEEQEVETQPVKAEQTDEPPQIQTAKEEKVETVSQAAEEQKQVEKDEQDISPEVNEGEEEEPDASLPVEEEREEAKVSITLKGTKRDPVTVTTSLLSPYTQREQAAVENVSVEETVEAKEAERTVEEERAEKKANTFYLMSFMKQEEEKFTRLKMCIAQQDETLDGIAERYNVTAADIAEANGLHTNATVARGQVLYIPVKS
jgi:stage VI sporulation protein D